MPSAAVREKSVCKKGDRLTFRIDDLAETGDGVSRYEGLVFFVKDAVPGDLVEASVMKVKNRYGYAHLDRILEPSEDRIEPACPAARACGGCQLQACSYDKECRWKEKRLRDALVRVGGFDGDLIERICLPIGRAASEADSLRYRNKAQLPVAQGRDGAALAGFYAARTHSIIPVDDCLLSDEVFSDIRRIVLEHMKNCGISAYDEKTGRGLVRHILMRIGRHSGQVMVCLVLNASSDGARSPDDAGFADAGGLSDRLFGAVPGMTSFSFNLNDSRSNVILGRVTMPVAGEPWIEDEMCGLRFRISPTSFYQVNTVMAERLYEQAMSFAGLTGRETVVDLYCGIGTISLVAAKSAARVTGVEVVPEAVRDARSNAVLNGIDNAEFREGRAEDILPELAAGGMRPDVLIVDPPRAGLDERCVQAMLDLAPGRIVYISCNPSTLARDLKLLCVDYELAAVQPWDLFPRTVHCETAAKLVRRSGPAA